MVAAVLKIRLNTPLYRSDLILFCFRITVVRCVKCVLNDENYLMGEKSSFLLLFAIFYLLCVSNDYLKQLAINCV